MASALGNRANGDNTGKSDWRGKKDKREKNTTRADVRFEHKGSRCFLALESARQSRSA